MILIFSLVSAIFMAGFSMGIKILLRYRLCDAGYVIFGINIASGVLAGAGLLVVRVTIPTEAIAPFAVMTVFVFVGHWLFSKSLQEGDASLVAPLLGLKIPMVALLARFWLGESFPAGIYAAVIMSTVAVVFFCIGRQQKAQGGHGRHPLLAVALSALAALSYSVSDIFTSKTIQWMSPFETLLLLQAVMGLMGLLILALPGYRQYCIQKIDYLLFGLGGAMLLGGIGFYLGAIHLGGTITIPNIILSWRGLFVFLMGLVWNAFAPVVMEKQYWTIYLFRLIGTVLLLAALIFLYFS